MDFLCDRTAPMTSKNRFFHGHRNKSFERSLVAGNLNFFLDPFIYLQNRYLLGLNVLSDCSANKVNIGETVYHLFPMKGGQFFLRK